MADAQDALGALRDGVVAVLTARGARDEAAVVARAELHLLPGARTWSIGSREVEAHAFELSLDAPAFVRLERIPGGRDRVKDALADAVATGATMLADLFVVLRLPETPAGWGSAYRSAPRRRWEPPSDEAAVHESAVALLDAEGDRDASRVLARGRLTAADVSSSGDALLRRWVVSLPPAEMAEVLRSAPVGESLRRAVSLAATRAKEIVASVDLAVVSSA